MINYSINMDFKCPNADDDTKCNCDWYLECKRTCYCEWCAWLEFGRLTKNCSPEADRERREKKIFPRGFHTSCEFLRADTEEGLEPFCFLELTGVDSKHPFCTTLPDGTKVEVKPRRASFLLYACRLLIYISWQCGANFPACVELLSYLLPHIEANEKRQLAYATKEGLSRRKPPVTDEDD
jgi:hypothetical protein